MTNPARALAGALEPVIGQVYFSPECHAAYAELGFGPSPGSSRGVANPDGVAYFCSRGSVLGQVPGTVVAAVFGVFNPEVVVPALAHGWTLTDAATIEAARTHGATAQLVRLLGERPDRVDEARDLLARTVEPLRPEGKPLFAGLRALGLPGDTVGDVWRLGDMLREFRGDAHIAAWTSAGFDATEIGLITELFWGLRMRTYVRTRAWTDAQLDAALERLEARGLVADGVLTEDGRAQREAVEAATDRMCHPIVAALGEDLETLLEILRPWGQAVRDGHGYPGRAMHDLAEAAAQR
ncbi:SCO6745 family protein [Pseudonocardia sp. GCM10023141]|uniref:SCO6745 family protein n=1 Tax=Pseudonocardia sp. GCM10023141 TaxID=3252653 RepID=UPI0036098B3F